MASSWPSEAAHARALTPLCTAAACSCGRKQQCHTLLLYQAQMLAGRQIALGMIMLKPIFLLTATTRPHSVAGSVLLITAGMVHIEASHSGMRKQAHLRLLRRCSKQVRQQQRRSYAFKD